MSSYVIKGTRRVLKPNATVVSGLRIENNVASGFSGSNFVKTPETFPAPTTSFEAKAKVVTPSAFDVCNIIYYCGGSFAIQHDAANVSVISFWIYKAGTGFERVIAVPSTTLLATRKPYWFKVTWDGSVYNLLYSTDDVIYTSLGTYASTTPLLSSGTVAVGLNDGGSKYPYLGSIDLNESYIKINNELWWSGTKLMPENKYYVFRRKRNRYYKDVVTTKYWKEVTETVKVVDYACFKDGNYYFYAKTPLGSTMQVYGSSDGRYAVSTSLKTYNFTWTTLSETSATMNGRTQSRYYAGDVTHSTTTTTVVEGTPDDYTYTTTETTTIEVTSNDEYDRVESGGESTYFPTLKGVN